MLLLLMSAILGIFTSNDMFVFFLFWELELIPAYFLIGGNFTSDKNEGWGAVLNESMNSACAVVASDAIGAVPFLLQDGENGLCYRSCDVDDLYKKVKFLLDHEEERKVMGKNAYETVTSLWNAEVAAQRLLDLSEQILQGNKRPTLYGTGPCSKAQILKDND